MIELEKETSDNPTFVSRIEDIIVDQVKLFDPQEIYIIKINNWFDQKWLKFSGTILHELSIWKSDITLPPFHPNRVNQIRHYLIENGEYIRSETDKQLHIYQQSSKNLKRKISDISSDGLFIWYSGNSEKNEVGSIMIYLMKNDGCHTFYISLDKSKEWKSGKMVGLNKLIGITIAST